MSSPRLRVIFRPRTDIQTFFSPKIRWSPKKKKKKRSSPKLRVVFRPRTDIQTFFSPKIRWSPKKKKKRSSPKLRVVFRPRTDIQTFFSPKIRWSPKKKKKKVFTEIKSDLSVENGNFFFFWDHLILGEKKVWISVFGEDIRIFEVLCLKSPPPKFSRSATGGTPFAHFAHS